jgi:hypothetical protein
VNPINTHDICFVFTEQNLQEPNFSWAGGMHRAYLLRYVSVGDITFNDKVLSVRAIEDSDGHVPFPKLEGYAVSYAESMWYGLMAIYETLQKGLNRYGQKQPLYFNIPLCFPATEVFQYLLRQVRDLGSGTIKLLPKKSSSVRIGSGLTKYRRISSESTVYTMLRFDSQDSLKTLRRILGCSSTYGVRSRPPTLQGHPQGKNVLEYNYIHYIKGKETEETPFASRTNRRGIDIRFDHAAGLKISGRFKKWLYKVGGEGQPVDCPSSHLLQVLYHFRVIPNVAELVDYDSDASRQSTDSESLDTNDEATNTTECSLHSLFTPDVLLLYQGVVHVIKEVSKDSIVCCVEGNDNPISKTLLRSDPEVRNGIRRYNGCDEEN